MKKVALYLSTLFVLIFLISCSGQYNKDNGNGNSLHSKLNNTTNSTSTVDSSIVDLSKETSLFTSSDTDTEIDKKDSDGKNDEDNNSLDFEDSTSFDDTIEKDNISEETSEIFDTNSLDSSENSSEEFVKSGTRFVNSDFIMMYQTDAMYKDMPYGINTIGSHGCGPSTMAVIIRNIKGDEVTPLTMCNWSYENGYYAENIGSYHALIPAAANKWGLDYKTFYSYDRDLILDNLKSGHLVLVVMGPGTFTRSGHFMVLRGIDENGQIIIADTQSPEKSSKAWDFEFIYSELKKGSPLSIFK